MKLTWETLTRFWSKVAVGTKKECWPWVGSVDNHGYGQINLGGRPIKAPRVAFVASGRRLGKLCALHKCDNPACCNPSHLFLGTKADNMADKMAKGRHRTNPPRGERHYAAKLTETTVRTIRREAAKGISQTVLAERFDVDRTMVSRIVLRKNWRHVR